MSSCYKTAHAFDSHALPPIFIQHSPGKYKSLNDSRLYILVSSSVDRLWRFKYIYGGKEKLLALAIYRMVGLSAARQRRDDAKRLLESGVDPSINRKAIKAARDEAASCFSIGPDKIPSGKQFKIIQQTYIMPSTQRGPDSTKLILPMMFQLDGNKK